MISRYYIKEDCHLHLPKMCSIALLCLLAVSSFATARVHRHKLHVKHEHGLSTGVPLSNPRGLSGDIGLSGLSGLSEGRLPDDMLTPPRLPVKALAIAEGPSGFSGLSYQPLITGSSDSYKHKQRGPYKGLGKRKVKFLEAGGTTHDLAVALLESPALLVHRSRKTGDHAEFGLFKQTWKSLRTQKSTKFTGKGKKDWAMGLTLNKHLKADIHSYHAIVASGSFRDWVEQHITSKMHGHEQASMQAVELYISEVQGIFKWLTENHGEHLKDDFSYM